MRAVRWTDLSKSQVRRGEHKGGVPTTSIQGAGGPAGDALGWFIEVSGTAVIGSRTVYLKLRCRALKAQRAVRWPELSKSRVQL